MPRAVEVNTRPYSGTHSYKKAERCIEDVAKASKPRTGPAGGIILQLYAANCLVICSHTTYNKNLDASCNACILHITPITNLEKASHRWRSPAPPSAAAGRAVVARLSAATIDTGEKSGVSTPLSHYCRVVMWSRRCFLLSAFCFAGGVIYHSAVCTVLDPI